MIPLAQALEPDRADTGADTPNSVGFLRDNSAFQSECSYVQGPVNVYVLYTLRSWLSARDVTCAAVTRTLKSLTVKARAWRVVVQPCFRGTCSQSGQHAI